MYVMPLDNNESDLEPIKNKAGCSTIILNNIAVPAGTTLDLTKLKDGTHVIFQGKTPLGYKEWEGPLISFTGNNLLIEGAAGHSIDCQGERCAHSLKNSNIKKLNVLNTPVQAFSINSVTNLGVYDVHLDNSLGDTKGGHNTDAFDVGSSNGVYISGARWSWSIGSVGGRSDNVVKTVRILNSAISNSDNGVRIKTVSGKTGSVSDVKYDGITLTNIAKYGIVIEQDYENGSPTGVPTSGVPITDVTINKVTGTVNSSGTNVYILCASCKNWTWTNNKVTGGKKSDKCKGVPTGASC
ncbi:Endopolygalacturonase 1 [Fusarium proliferatum]|uniref:Endopolygalacturonase 1 n=1 Tax=Gibberella intermedia TaxID=948311 RepID=A0A420RWL5_GIBIN|nr:Endopolygalacturonase 1 [Fusarium proliferatum]